MPFGCKIGGNENLLEMMLGRSWNGGKEDSRRGDEQTGPRSSALDRGRRVLVLFVLPK